MTRNAIRTVLATVALSMAAAPMMIGCKASASVGGGDTTPKPPPPPPPPPPPAATPAPTPAAPPPAAPKAIKPPDGGGVAGDKVTLPGAIVFVTGKADIKPESEATLQVLKKFMDDNPQITLFRIEGHTDSDGDDAMNLKLSGNRALASVTWLANHGVARDRLIAVGFGKTKPIADNATAAGKEQNRRTEFHIAAIDGKAFLGRPGDGGGSVFKLAFAGHPAVKHRGSAVKLGGPSFFSVFQAKEAVVSKPRSLVAAGATLLVAAAVGCSAQMQAQAGAGTTPIPSSSAPPPPAMTSEAPAASSAPPPADEPKIKAPSKGSVKGSQIAIPGAIIYDTGKATIKPESEAVLSVLKQFLEDNPSVTLLRIEGHTDSDGDDNANLKLSGNRAVSCVKWLTDKGIDRSRLLAVGFGEMRPIADNNTKDGKEMNRRTEFHVAAIEGKAYLGRAPDGGGTIFK